MYTNQHISLTFLIALLFFLILLSAFFSSSETSMMALNRYRVRHKARLGNKKAQRVMKLLEKTDHLLSTILVGNNFINILISSLGTMIALQLLGSTGVFVSAVILTFALLIFGEVTPKMLAAAYPEKVAFAASFLLTFLMKLLYPINLTIHGISAGILRLFCIKIRNKTDDHLNHEELRTLVHDSHGLLPSQRQGMLLGVLDLDMVDVDHIMIPRNEIVGIDLEDNIDEILNHLQNIQHTRVLVYMHDINNIIGVLHMRNLACMMSKNTITKAAIREIMTAPYYVPEGTPLHTQLYNFQKEKHRLAVVVDEYGDIQGLLTLEDILEEIVGEFNKTSDSNDIIPRKDGSFTINGAANIHDINKSLQWDLPIDGPKTINGLIMEVLEAIPDGRLCLMIKDYQIDILTLSGNKVETARIYSRAHKKNDH